MGDLIYGYRGRSTSTGFYFYKDTSLLSADRTFTLPDKDGTFAMLDDVSTFSGTLDDIDAGSTNVHLTTTLKSTYDGLVSNSHAPGSDDQDLSNLVEKVTGKGLSTNDYTTAEQTKVSNLSGTNTGDEIAAQTDGFTITKGTTPRVLSVSGANITMVGSGAAVITFPPTTATLARTDAGQTFTGVQVFSSIPTFSAGSTATGQITVQGNVVVDATTVPAEGMYRPTGAGNLGFAVSSAAELLLTATAFSPAVSDGNALGTTALMWGDLFLASGGVINFNAGASLITHSAGILTIGGSGATTLALGTNSITMSGSIGVTGTRVTKLWATAVEVTTLAGLTIGGTAILSSLTAPQFTTIELGAASDTTLARVAAGVVSVEGVKIPTIQRQTNTSTSTNLTITSTQYGSTLFWSPAGTATATLPANAATTGSWFDVILLTDQTVTISAATADTLIVDGDTAADSVAFSTASHKIGSAVRFISNGSVWIAINIGSTTMTIAT